MDSGPGWLPDPEDENQERYWSGSVWTDRVRPAGMSPSARLPGHVPELQRALAAATADIDAVEERLSNLFDRAEGRGGRPDRTAATPDASSPQAVRAATPDSDDEPIDFEEEPMDYEDEATTELIDAELAGSSGAEEEEEDEDAAAFADLDAALSAEDPEEIEEPDEPPRSGFFRRRS